MPETQADSTLPGILADIVGTKLEELSRARARTREIERRAERAQPPRGFEDALRGASGIAVIAECKRRSPGAGDILPDLDPARVARAYERGGAAALSVLTDATYFGGSVDDLTAARDATRLPVLRKDFLLDPLQVIESRACSADAVLLIVRVLSDAQLARLLEEARGLGMASLVEAHDAREVDRALAAGARILGINNRDLATFTTDLEATLRLMERVPEDVLVVSESGIHGPDDVARLAAAGIRAVLVGESLLRAPDPEAAVAALAGVRRGEGARA